MGASVEGNLFIINTDTNLLVNENQLLIPRVASKALPDGTMVSMPYDDMYPFLGREEYSENCVYKTM